MSVRVWFWGERESRECGNEVKRKGLVRELYGNGKQRKKEAMDLVKK